MKPEQESVVNALLTARAISDSFACRIREKTNLSYQMFVRVKILCEVNHNASILVISPLKSIFERPFAGDRITGYPTIDCSNLPVLFADVNSKYWL